jgi:molecular chaperone HscB
MRPGSDKKQVLRSLAGSITRQVCHCRRGRVLGEALRMAALNNDAYKTLRSADATMAYILKCIALLEDEEKYSLPPAFLMEMMDINEAVSDYEMATTNDSARQMAISSMEDQLQQLGGWRTDLLTTGFDKGDHSEGLLRQIEGHVLPKKILIAHSGKN